MREQPLWVAFFYPYMQPFDFFVVISSTSVIIKKNQEIMETKNKRHQHQILNPFLGFGWYTGGHTSKYTAGTKTKILRTTDGLNN